MIIVEIFSLKRGERELLVGCVGGELTNSNLDEEFDTLLSWLIGSIQPIDYHNYYFLMKAGVYSCQDKQVYWILVPRIYMNQYQRNQDPRNRKKPSIDGISSRPVTRFNKGSNFGDIQNSRRDSNLGSNQGTGAVGDFSRRDGFHASAQQQITTNKTAETFIIDRKTTKKTKFKKEKPQYNQSRKKSSKKKRILKILGILLIVATLVLGFLTYKGYITVKKILPGGGLAPALSKEVDISQLKGEGDGRVNILLLGRGGEGHEGADLTDTIILASIDPIAKEASLLSVPRDLYVPVKSVGSMKVNSVFFTGKANYLNNQQISTSQSAKLAEQAGFEMLEATLESALGVPIHYHLMVDFDGFEQAVNNVGGITINAPDAVSEHMRIKGQNYFLNVNPGWQDMDGFEALAYSRSRYTSPRGDFDRSERQRIIITALKDKILSAGTFGNPQKISNLLNTFGNHLQTNFSVADLQRLYEISKEIPSDKIASIGLADPPNNFVRTDNIGGLSVVVPTAGTGNFKEIQGFIRNALKDSFLKNENASVMVLNGTNKSGLATEKGDELKSFGYTVTKVDNAPTRTYEKTIVVDLRNGTKKYTKNYLERRFSTTAVGTVPDPAIIPDTADFVIILGNDQASGL